MQIDAFERERLNWPSRRRHAASAAGSLRLTWMRSRGSIWILQLPPAHDLVGVCKISYPWTYMCFCGSGAHSRYRTAGWRRPLQLVSTLTGVTTSSIAFCHCQPALCISDLADLLRVSHFNLLVPVICRFFASTRSLYVLDVSSAH